MANQKPLIVVNGTNQQLPNADTLVVGTGIDTAAVGTLTVGASTANAITIGSSGITTTFPGPVNLTGDVTTVGGTQFTTDAQFDGNVTLGNAATDTVTFTAEVASNIAFKAPGYKITNLANGTNPGDAVNFSQLSAAAGVQPITTISTTTTLDGTNYTVLCSATLTVNLPAAASNTGRVYNIKNIGAAATITIDPNASETIDGATTYTLTTQYQTVTIQCDGSNWFIL